MTRRSALGCMVLSAVLATALSGCSGTLDSLGKDPTELPTTFEAVTKPTNYPNTFSTLLKKSDSDVSNKIGDAFDQLFLHGDPGTQVIYYPRGDDQAAILDILHGNVRTEGMGLAMLIAVELDKQDVFDRLWTFSKVWLRQDSGAAHGYFKSYCGEGTQGVAGTFCYDVYGMQQFVLALMFADGRWHSTTVQPYASDALALLDVLQNKELENGGVKPIDDGGVMQDVGSAFDPTTHLVREEPTVAAAGYTRSALEMPAAYELWAQATGNTFWSDAADAARAHVVAAADATTGLWPIRSFFDGSPVPDSSTFTQQAYRTHLNLALDALWGTETADETAVADRVLGFFAQNPDTYGGTFALDGTPIDTSRAQALISANGALAVASSRSDRTAFVNAVWAQAIPTGDNRYYDGLMYLMSLLVLSGQLRVW